jgi:hypothetical protein
MSYDQDTLNSIKLVRHDVNLIPTVFNIPVHDRSKCHQKRMNAEMSRQSHPPSGLISLQEAWVQVYFPLELHPPLLERLQRYVIASKA